MSGHFTPLPLPLDVRDRAPDTATGQGFDELFGALPGGARTFWGVPFVLARRGAHRRWSWIGPGARPVAKLPVDGTARYIVVVHLTTPPPSPRYGDTANAWIRDRFRDVGECVAEYVLVYADGLEHRVPIRRGFEIGSVPAIDRPFAARPHESETPLDFHGPFTDAHWSESQQGVRAVWTIDWKRYELGWVPIPQYWLHAIENPWPDRRLRAVRFEALGSTPVAIAALTAFHGRGDPLRHRPVEVLRLSHANGRDASDGLVRVDLGIVARQYRVRSIDPAAWLEAPKGWGSPIESAPGDPVVEVAAAEGATLEVDGERVAMGEVFDRGHAESDGGRVRVELLTPRRRWIEASVVDAVTGTPTPARVSMHSPDGRYWPPHGQRHEVNDGWFEDYGADLRLGDTQFAYVDGGFAAELPIGPLHVEVVKGFEYEPLRSTLEVEPSSPALTLRLVRTADWRSRGWIAADTHVHFLSPQTAWLEARAEGINVVNLLAAQWGDLFTNVGDLARGRAAVSEPDTIIQVGTENRQHMLGHINLLGAREPVTPLSAAGPGESAIGDPVWTGLGEWADRCREHDGVVVIPHFPGPYCELVAAIVLGKVDGVELRDFGWGVDSYGVGEWYRFLNCGYRVAAVGGTDKMSASMPLGGVRTYAHIGDEELSFEAWAQALRAGRTVTSSGPLIELEVEGRPIGTTIDLPSGGATLEVEARAEAGQPITSLELVHDGRVVERVEDPAGSHELRLSTRVQAGAPGWLAARCSGPQMLWHEWPVRTAAHTSPVYLAGGGRRPAAAQDRAFLTTILDGGMAWLDRLATVADQDRHARVRGVFSAARKRLAS